MSNFNVSVETQEGLAIIKSFGYINNLGGEKIAQECEHLFEKNFNKLILNLENSSIVNSIGISILIEIIEKVLAKDGHLAFTNLTPTIAKTFRIMGLLQYADHYPDVSTAVEAMKKYKTRS